MLSLQSQTCVLVYVALRVWRAPVPLRFTRTVTSGDRQDKWLYLDVSKPLQKDPHQRLRFNQDPVVSDCAPCDCASVVRLTSSIRSFCDLCIRFAEDGEPTNVDSLVVGQEGYPKVMFSLLHHVLFAGYQLVAVSCTKGKHRSGAILSFVAHRPSTIGICIVQRSSVCMHARYPTHVC